MEQNKNNRTAWYVFFVFVVILISIFAASLANAETIHIRKMMDDIIVSGDGIDGSQYIFCNESCDIPYAMDECEALYVINKTCDYNYTQLEDLLCELNRSVIKNGEIYSLNDSFLSSINNQNEKIKTFMLNDFWDETATPWMKDQIVEYIKNDNSKDIAKLELNISELTGELKSRDTQIRFLNEEIMTLKSEHTNDTWALGIMVVTLFIIVAGQKIPAARNFYHKVMGGT